MLPLELRVTWEGKGILGHPLQKRSKHDGSNGDIGYFLVCLMFHLSPESAAMRPLAIIKEDGDFVRGSWEHTIDVPSHIKLAQYVDRWLRHESPYGLKDGFWL